MRVGKRSCVGESCHVVVQRETDSLDDGDIVRLMPSDGCGAIFLCLSTCKP